MKIQQIKKSKIHKKAFTIVELLVVIVVIGILAAITIVSYSGISKRAVDVALKTTLSNSSKLLKMYHVEYETYPTALDSNNCPSAPNVNSNYCLKLNTGEIIDSYVGDQNSFTLTIVHDNGTSFSIDEEDTIAEIENGGGGGGGSSSWKILTVGDTNNCYISNTDGRIYCWGEGEYGQLGNNSTTASYTPVTVQNSGVLSGKTITSIDSGLWHTCVIANDNYAYCWGSGGYGQLGNLVGMADSLVPVAVTKTGVLSGKTIKQISAGDWHTCAIASDNLAYCWAYSEYGQLGDPATMALGASPDPVAVVTTGVLSGKTIKQISAGGSSTCAIASDDKAYCWGYNWAGALGNNSTTDSGNPVAVNTAGVMSGKTIKQIATGGSHTCAIASDDQVYCWGYNAYGELGNNSTSNSLVPVAVNTAGVLSGKTVKQLDVSSEHTCVIASDDKVYCWGRNRRGQIGDGTTTNRLVPTLVTDYSLSTMTIKQVQIAYNHSCAIAGDNNYYCWGRSSYAAE